MDTIFTIPVNSKTSDPHRLLLNLSDMIDEYDYDEYLLHQILAFTIHGKISKYKKKSYKNNKVQYQLQHKEFQLPDGSYSLSNIQDYSEDVIKNHKQLQIII